MELKLDLESSIKWLMKANKNGVRGFCYKDFLILFEYKSGKRIKESFFYRGNPIVKNELSNELRLFL